VGVNFGDGPVDCAIPARAKEGWHLGCFLEIIMRLLAFLVLAYSLVAQLLFAVVPSSSAAVPAHVTAAAIIHEMNLARQNPALYATFIEETRRNYSGRICLLPGNVRMCTHEGVRALDDAIQFLSRATRAFARSMFGCCRSLP